MQPSVGIVSKYVKNKLRRLTFSLTHVTLLIQHHNTPFRRDRVFFPRNRERQEEISFMKSWNIIPKIAAAGLLLCAGSFLFAQDEPYSRIPKGAALIMKLDLGKLYSTQTFHAAAESGEILSIRDNLKKIPWNKAGTTPDPLIVYAPSLGESFAMIVPTDKNPQELAEALKTKYGKQKTVESEKNGVGEMITVKYPRTDRKTKKQRLETEAEILYLSPQVAAFGKRKCPLNVAFFADETLPASEFENLRKMSEHAVAAGIMRSFPIPASVDPTGLSSLVKSGDFRIYEHEPGAASLVLNLECKGDNEARLAARRMKSFIRILLVTLFSADKSLFKELNACYTSTNTGSKATLDIKISKESMDRIREFYLADTSILSSENLSGIGGAK